jgi:hypothetical protein
MDTDHKQREMALRLSAQRALWGAITPNVRAVSAEWRAGSIVWRGIFHAEPDDTERELLSVALTEVIADFPDVTDCDEEFLVIPAPRDMQHLAHLLYLRHE